MNMSKTESLLYRQAERFKIDALQTLKSMGLTGMIQIRVSEISTEDGAARAVYQIRIGHTSNDQKKLSLGIRDYETIGEISTEIRCAHSTQGQSIALQAVAMVINRCKVRRHNGKIIPNTLLNSLHYAQCAIESMINSKYEIGNLDGSAGDYLID